jgi:hypothetical protein
MSKKIHILDVNGNEIKETEVYENDEYYDKSEQQGKPYYFDDKILAKINEKNNLYWSSILGTTVQFDIGRVDVAYTTLSDTGLERNRYLQSLFLKPPVVVDAYAGCGMDSISFLFNLYWQNGKNIKKLYVVENLGTEERNYRLKSNLMKFVQIRDPALADRIDFCLWGTEQFFKNCMNFKVDPVDSIDLLYLDPPWTVPGRQNSGKKGEATPQELLQFLYDTIFEHLIKANINVRVACIKTRFEWDEISNITDLLRQKIKDPKKHYIHRCTIQCRPFNGLYYFHTISTVEDEFAKWEGSAVYAKSYGKNRVKNGNSQKEIERYKNDLVNLDPTRRKDIYEVPEEGKGSRWLYRPGRERRA